MKTIEIKNYNISVYGDGNREYEGYYMVVVDEFDEYGNPTKRKKVIYLKADSFEIAKEFITFLICESGYTIDLFANCEKIHINKRIMWEVHSK